MLLAIVLSVPAALLLIPGAVLLFECVAARLTTDPLPPGAADRASRLAILIPANDEAGQIGPTVAALAAELGQGDRLVVVADNCSDATASVVATVAASLPAVAITAIERRDPFNVGKGFAISFGVQHLTADPPDVVVLVDADCRVSPGAIAVLASQAARTGRPVQGEYLLAAPPHASPLARVSAFAFLLRNRVRPRGLMRLGLPCLLTGSGMAFPWKLLRDGPETRGNLVEDMVLGLELALGGCPPLLCPQAQISSELPPGRQTGLRQRRRWEHGHLHTLVTYVPRLLAAGLARRQLGLFGLAADLFVPPLALLVLLQLAVASAALGLAVFHVPVAVPLILTVAGLAATSSAVGVAWWRFARGTVPARLFLVVPLYLLWKMPLYALLLLKGKQQKWERTARPDEDGIGPAPPTPR
ncbi:MAG TPA: glycosyltransferase family 2 protein [Polyangia bacterium]|jgi:cellulose synthase/poly-beta-1,6-N-acetylglucosamine synthase-like glycosyltransferase|nr:glycosyltransferase family 2 protein [Polyangia bacterium]